MDRVTFWLFFLLIPHWGEAQNCSVGCNCQSSPNKLECQTIPNAPIPPLTTEFKSAGSPENLTSEVFLHLKPYSVEILDLSQGNIVNVGDDAFVAFGKAIIIDLSRNRIETLGKNTLRGCVSLKEIWLRQNRISKIADSFFANLPKLRTINLGHNTLDNLPSGFPQVLRNLDISYNKIRNLESSETHVRFFQVHFLNVCGNPIEGISQASCHWRVCRFCTPGVLNLPQEMRISIVNLELMVGLDPITYFTDLKGFYSLEKLKIVGFQINSFIWPDGVGPKITHLAFNSVSCCTSAETQFFNSLQHTSVEKLDLSGSSQLARIFIKNLTAWRKVLQYLQVLVLRSCNLTSLNFIRAQDLAPRAFLSIDVSGNPLHCDCVLVNHLKVKKILLVGIVAHCETPDRYRGHDLPSILHLLCPSAQTLQEDSTTQMMENWGKTTPMDEAGVLHVSGNDPDWTVTGCRENKLPGSYPYIPQMQEKSTTQIAKKEENPTPVDEDEMLKSKYNDVLAHLTMHSIVLMVVAIAICALIFFVLLFYLRRKCRPNVDRGTVLYTVRPDGSQVELLL